MVAGIFRIAVLDPNTTHDSRVSGTGSDARRPSLLPAPPTLHRRLINSLCSSMSGKLNTPKNSNETTLRRLAKIQGHLSTRPRSERLKDKVCIVTGVGSLTGIGYVLLLYQQGQF